MSRSSPVLLQTTCCVQIGVSGGPVIAFNYKPLPEIIGIVVSNAIFSSDGSKNGVLYPKFNMAVPASVFKRPVMKYIETDGEYLKLFKSIVKLCYRSHEVTNDLLYISFFHCTKKCIISIRYII